MTQTRNPSIGSLVAGLNHAAIITSDLDRLADFYVGVFDAKRIDTPAPPGTRATTVQLTETAGLALLEMPDNPFVAGSQQMLDRGHVDHIALDAATPAALNEIRLRLVAYGASDGSISDYGPMLSVYFTDPDGMGSEVCWIRDHSMAGAHAPVPFEGSLLDLEVVVAKV